MTTPKPNKRFIIATRGSALALAQTRQILAQCQRAFPRFKFEIKILKTTGDKMQSASLAHTEPDLPKGLFTKELEVALLNQEADLAVHSLKDLPTDLPAGLKLGAVTKRAEVRDLLIYRDAEILRQQSLESQKQPQEWRPGDPVKRGFRSGLTVAKLPERATIATSSTRRQAQLLACRPDLQVVPMRGNVSTRLRKLVEQPEIDALILACAGLDRLGLRISPRSEITLPPISPLAAGNVDDPVPPGLLATRLELDEMLPCVGQGAIGIEVRDPDERLGPICECLNHFITFQCVSAERAFLHALGGGCQSPVAAYAQVLGHEIHLTVVSFRTGASRRAEARRPLREGLALGEALAAQILKEEA